MTWLTQWPVPIGANSSESLNGLDQATGMVLQAWKFEVPDGDVPWKVRMRVCVWFSCLLGRTPADTVRDLQSVFGEDSIKPAAVRSLMRQFRDGRQEMCDLKRSGRPPVQSAPDKVDQVKQLVTQTPRTTIARLANRAGLKSSTTHNILRRKLKLKKHSCKLVPHDLTDVQKASRVTSCVKFLQNCERPRWLERVITADESWFYVVNPNPKCDNIVWTLPGTDCLQVPRRPMNTKKAMAIPFFNWKGLIYCHWVINGTVTGLEYRRALLELRNQIRQKRLCMWRCRRVLPFLLHEDNASPHTCTDTRRFQVMSNIKKVEHPPYSPDLSSCDFFLFPTVKRALRGRSIATVQDLMQEVDRLMGQIPSWRWKRCFSDWKWRALRCIDFDGNYFEGMTVPPPFGLVLSSFPVCSMSGAHLLQC